MSVWSSKRRAINNPTHSAAARVVSVIPSLARSKGGPTFGVVGLCEATARLGLSQSIVTIKSSNDEPELLPTSGRIETKRLFGCRSQALKLVYSPGLKQQLLRHCVHGDVQIIHNNGLWTQLNHAAVCTAVRLKLHLITSPHGMLATWALQHKSLRKKLGWWAYQRADLQKARVIRATAESEVFAIRKLGFRQPIAMVPNGIEIPDSLAPVNAKEGKIALFLGRIHPVKGLLNLVQAWGIVKPQGWRCLIAGPDEGGHRRVVEAAIRSNGLEREFAFLGPVEDEAKWTLYRSADVVVMPSFTENFCIVIAEALGCCVPVITTKGAPWRSLHSRNCGWWVDIGSDSLATALREATQLSDATRREMGFRGRQLVQEEYSWQSIGHRMAAVYEWMLGRVSKPDCVLLD